ncbi:serine/threonine-protein kinase [Nocardia huaxiensis]|uniref:non-specific serine/threonine protein kinase n=1 Tax=Nocardia huaxiensis TaxID=2755382 RepID=A0A7D6VDB5_9NOCA|nr:serine/threonine-protein kinase [Nocardia huaxiensis]QLY31762.1 serine/threonine protein kinase [Nocardia huaxiensis]UFS95323.1 serine/threonine protein kinase [Nocardia huaxiensis]
MPGEDRWLGHYRLIRLLGQGGMGQVWRAEDTHMGREVALKVLPGELADDAEYRKRFEREARLAARLRGPHVVPIHTFGERDGRLFIDMELVDGVDLGKVLAKFGPLTPSRAVDLIGQVGEALDTAHAAGLVHRDVKPSNVLTLQNGYAYLIDFGVARGSGQATITASGVALGTFAYMAPERIAGESEQNHRSDVYSLACMLYQCLTGKLPFTVTDPVQQLAAHLNNEPPRASTQSGVPAALDAVIARGMAKDPARRYASAGDLAKAARAALNSPPQTPPVPLPVARWDAGGRIPPQPTPPPRAQTPATPPPAAYAQHPMPAHYSGGIPRGVAGRAPIGIGRRVWWVVLGLLLAFFLLWSIATIGVTVTKGFGSVGENIAANLMFHAPFLIFVYLAIREIKRYQNRQ